MTGGASGSVGSVRVEANRAARARRHHRRRDVEAPALAAERAGGDGVEVQIVRPLAATRASEPDGALFPRQPAGGDERLQRGDRLAAGPVVDPDGRVVLQIAADPRQVMTSGVIPSARSSSAAPIPERSSTSGEPYAPAARMTLSAAICAEPAGPTTSNPVTRVPSRVSLSARVSGTMRRFGRWRTGSR